MAPSVSMESSLVLRFWLLQLLPWRNIVERYLQDLAVSLYIMIDAIALNFGCTRRQGGEWRKRERQVGR